MWLVHIETPLRVYIPHCTTQPFFVLLSPVSVSTSAFKQKRDTKYSWSWQGKCNNRELSRMKTLSSSREVPKMPSLDAWGAPWLLGGQFLKPEILISDVWKASPWLGVWDAPVAAAPPTASWEASLGTTAPGNHFWSVACYLIRGRWHV